MNKTVIVIHIHVSYKLRFYSFSTPILLPTIYVISIFKSLHFRNKDVEKLTVSFQKFLHLNTNTNKLKTGYPTDLSRPGS